MSAVNRTCMSILAAAAVTAANAHAQIISGGGARHDPGIKQPPPPGQSRITTREAFTIETVNIDFQRTGPVFMLQIDTKRGLGPYRYKDDTIIGIKNDPFSILNSTPESFNLRSELRDKVFGPFKFADEEKIKTDSSSFVLIKKYAFIGGTIKHSQLIGKNTPVHLLRVDQKLYNSLAQLRAQLISLERAHEIFKTPRKIVGPTIRSIHGNVHRPYLNRSEKDIAKDKKSTDVQARSYFQNFCKLRKVKTVKAGTTGKYSFGGIQPGRYMVCCQGIKRNDKRFKLIRSQPTFWWTHINLEAGDAVELHLNEENEMEWTALFVEEETEQ